MEKRDLYDKDRNLTGMTIFKGDHIPDGYYITVVLCIMQNSEGKFLIQKRSKSKNGLYASTGGHPKSGESSLKGMITEIEEELGLKVLPEELELVFSGKEDYSKVFFDVYFLQKDFEISDLILQKDEVESVHWMYMHEIKSLIYDNKFMSNHAEEFFRAIDIFKKRRS